MGSQIRTEMGLEAHLCPPRGRRCAGGQWRRALLWFLLLPPCTGGEMPGELFCIKIVLHKRRGKTLCSICFYLFSFHLPWGSRCQRQGDPAEVPREGLAMWPHVSGLDTLRGLSHPSQAATQPVSQAVKEKCPFLSQWNLCTASLPFCNFQARSPDSDVTY